MQRRLAFLYAPIDGWVHDGEAARVAALLPAARVETLPHALHAFVLQGEDAVARASVDALGQQFGWAPLPVPAEVAQEAVLSR